MRFIQDTTFRIRPDKGEQFQQWLIANQESLAASYPEGSSLYGVFVTVFGSQQGEVHFLEVLDSYATIDRMAAEAKKIDSEYRRLGDEMDEFIDFSRSMPVSNLMKDVLDATVVNVHLGADKELAPA